MQKKPQQDADMPTIMISPYLLRILPQITPLQRGLKILRFFEKIMILCSKSSFDRVHYFHKKTHDL